MSREFNRNKFGRGTLPREGAKVSLTARMSRIIEDAHQLVNEARAGRGLPPWDFNQPSRKRKPFSTEERLAAAASVPGIAGKLLRRRLAAGLGQKQAAHAIGMNLYRLIVIEKRERPATDEEELMIKFWLDLDIESCGP